MPHPDQVISQPLPHDLRNWSFHGMKCEGWDFSGCDIRGCDFSRAKLAGANFSEVIAGRSQEQKIEDIKLAILLLPVAIILAPVVALFSIGWFLAEYKELAKMPWSDNVPFTISIAIAFTIESMFIIPTGISVAIMSFGQGHIQDCFEWSAVSVGILALAFVIPPQAIERFKLALGTNFYSADLEGATFRNATLSNCNFDVACVKDVDWTNMTG